MNMLRGLLTLFLCLPLLGACAPAFAEVSVRVNRDGEYLATQVFFAGAYSAERKIWTPRGRGIRKAEVLNAFGDVAGDLWPAICEDPNPPYYPIVVWSHFGGVDYDLVWSRWTGDSWRDVEPIFGSAEPGDDLDPNLVFDLSSRPYVVWWRDEPGAAQVYASALVGNRWTSPILISDVAVDSRYPTVELNIEGTLTVTYETELDTVVRIISFAFPDTITEDVEPVGVEAVVRQVNERTD